MRPNMTFDEKLKMIETFEAERIAYATSPEGRPAHAKWEEVRRADHNGMAYWFPRIEAAGLPVPKTVLIDSPANLGQILDGETCEGFAEFVAAVQSAGQILGWPCFLRTEHGSGKHQWKDTCFLTGPDVITQHIHNLVEWSECVDMCGLSYFVWAVREMLPTIALGHCRRYGDMPICREIRTFTKGGKLACAHPYWPDDAVADGDPIWIPSYSSTMVCNLPSDGELEKITPLAEQAAAACPDDDWSIDFLFTKRGWYLTDMAIAARSWHWPNCQTSKEERCERRP
jgi:hypothetical protein